MEKEEKLSNDEIKKKKVKKSIRDMFNELDRKIDNCGDKFENNRKKEYDKKLNISFIDDEIEERFDINKLEKAIRKEKEISDDDFRNIFNKSLINIIFALIFVVFMAFVKFEFHKFAEILLIKNLHIFSFIFLGISIILIELFYKKGQGSYGINGIETMFFSIFVLILPYILQINKSNFDKIINISLIVIILYYIMKIVGSYFHNKKLFLRKRSDFIKDGDKSEYEEYEEDEDDEGDKYDDLE